MTGNLFKTVLSACAVLLPLASPAPAASNDPASENVRYLLYMNCSDAYTVNKLWVHYKAPGAKSEKIQLSRNVRSSRDNGKLEDFFGTCIDVSSMGIPDGSEVWLSYRIAEGDNESCKKDKDLVYRSSTENGAKAFYSSGTTLNKNRCKIDASYVMSPDECHRNFKRSGTCRWNPDEIEPIAKDK